MTCIPDLPLDLQTGVQDFCDYFLKVDDVTITCVTGRAFSNPSDAHWHALALTDVSGLTNLVYNYQAPPTLPNSSNLKMSTNDDVISISSGDSDGEPHINRRAILEPVVRRVVDALGGHEGDGYRLGDEVNGCLKDLKKLWRKDDTDDERTIARIFWETRVLPNDLVPILLATAGKGMVEDKRAILCADLMTAMTWPIDMAEELKELDEELDKGTDYTQLLLSHLNYKAALLSPGAVQALFGIMLPPLAKHPKERTERDGQVINVVLHLIRNLAFIKDLPSKMHLSSDQAEYSSLQTKLIKVLSETHTLELLLTIASNVSNDPLLNGWNTLVLEILYLLFRGVKPTSLTTDQAKVCSFQLSNPFSLRIIMQ